MPAFMSTRRYVALSLLSAMVVTWHAFSTREQFFPSMVYLSSSKFSLAVLGNMGFALALATYKLVIRVFLGRLRDSEVERVNDKVGQAVVETCLAMTIFREDFTASFLIMFVILSFVKIFHWLVQDRVDFIETTPNVSRLQHARIATFTLLLLAIDLSFLHYSLSKTMQHGVSVHLLFAFEYTVQASTVVLTFTKYCLSMADMAMEGRWEGKGVAVFYLDLTLDMLHLLVYCAFFAVVFSTYGIPLHLVRDLYWTFRNFQQRVRDFLRYRRITANMDHSFPEASEEELQRADHTCIICREEMTAQGRNKKLGCGHVFHLHCLRSWLERQQNCPICRRSVVPPAAAPPPPPRRAQGDDPPGPAAQQARAAGAAAAAAQRGAAGHGGADGAHVRGPGQGPVPRRRVVVAHGAAPAADAGGGGGLGLEGGWQMVAHYPQWVPAAPMALFVPAGGLHQLQYAGQQHPEQVLQAQQAATAGMVPLVMPLGMPLVAPPLMVPPAAAPPVAAGMPGSAAGGAGAHPAAAATPQQHMAAAAAAAAAAASLLAPLGGVPGIAPPAADPGHPATAAATAAAAAAMERVLQQQLEALRAHQERARHAQQAAAAASAASASASAAAGQAGVPAAPAAPGPSAPQHDSSAPSAPSARDTAASVAGGSSPAAAPQAQPAAAPEVQPAAAQPQAAGLREEQDSEADDVRRRRLERFGGA